MPGDLKTNMWGTVILTQRTESKLWMHRSPVTDEAGPNRPDYYTLGRVVPSVAPPPHHAADAPPRFQVSMVCLGGEQHAQQWWCVGGERPTTASQTINGLVVDWAQTTDFLFACVSIPTSMPVAQQSFDTYQTLLNTARARGKPHLLRVWNYVPQITEPENGVERYRLFNLGRKDAFRAQNYTLAEGAPAACALGTHGGSFQVAILASTRPGIAIENPRQVSSYHYPKQYGEDSPIFSRAAWLPQQAGDDVLFISGTASIVGHQTLHCGDVLAQTRESIRNIQALLQSANDKAQTAQWQLDHLRGCVYIRHAADYPAVRACLLEHGMTDFCFMQADICRNDLLVEIEAEGQLPHAR